MAAASSSLIPTIFSLSSSSTTTTTTISKARGPICSFPFRNFSRTNFASISTLKLSFRIAHPTSGVPKYDFRTPRVSCLDISNSEADSELGPSSVSSDSHKEATVDLKLPRRSLLVQFTCNACGERTQKLINRIAYERGTVFVQCAGCFKHHKLVDNLGLVVEYDFREDSERDYNADQV